MIIDDHPVIREGLCHLINHQDDLVCCAQAGGSEQAQAAAKLHHPDLAILDLRLKNADGIELIKVLRGICASLRIVILSQLAAPVYVERSLRAGASGYVLKEQGAEEILEAVRTVLRGEFYLPRGLAASVFGPREANAARTAYDGVEQLSNRELHVLRLLGNGLSTREIANDLKLSIKTIESHRENIKQKLGLRSAPELVHFASRWVREHITLSPQCARQDAGEAA